ncbi:PH domain-containing protein [Rugosimonospora acidiphila]|uniref:PH domain-containing protein n=1 Tax=Rugosimonospora acidiphila TaxID=556531 RepID=UPI0031EF1375
MGFPESVLTKDEHVEIHLHPHWKAMVRPVLVLVVVIIGIGAAWFYLPDESWSSVALVVLGVVGLILVLWLTVWPWMKWRTTHYVFTNERVIMREGVFSRNGRDIPLGRVNDVSFHHTFFERMLGCGTLVIESAGERGQVVLKEIPHVEPVQSRLYELVEADHDSHTFGDDDREALAEDIARTKVRKGGRDE